MKDSLRETSNRVRSFLNKEQRDRELDEELSSHLDLAVEDNVAHGMTAAEARRQALIRFGGVQQARERQRAARGLPWLDGLLQDLRYSLRTLRRDKAFALTAILILALGIGVNTAIFSVINGLLFSSLHINDENRMVTIAYQQKGNPWQPAFSLTEYQELRSQTKDVFSRVIADGYSLDGLSMQGNKPDRVFSDYVTGDYFQTLGVQPLLGRFFRPSEGVTPGADPVMVVGYGYWKQHFAGDPNIVGRQVAMDGHPVTVIGVTPENYRGLNTILTVQVYLPLAMMVPIENIPLAQWNKRDNRGMLIYARLRPGIAQKRANATLSVLAGRFATEDPSTEKDTALRAFPLYVGRNGFDAQNAIGVASALFLGLAGLVLLLACVNVANLLLVRATVREREIVIRSALGAQRLRLIRQMLTESVLLALLGGAAGVALGCWGSSLLSSVNLQTDLPAHFDFGFDWHVFAFSAVIAVLAGAIVGIVPALRLSRANLNLILREGGRGVAGGKNKFRDALVVLQVGSALMLLIIAGLFTKSLAQSEHEDLGFNPANVLTLTMDPGEIGYSDPQSRDFYTMLLERARALSGVESATTAGGIPMGLIASGSDTVTVNGYQPPPGETNPAFGFNLIGTDYFHTMQTALLEGRSFTEADNEKAPYVVIISQAMAKKFWPNQDPIGRQFTMSTNPTHPMQVVGVAWDARYRGLAGPIPPFFYVPFAQHYAQNSIQTLILRTVGDPARMIPEAEGLIHSVAPALPVFEVKTLHQALYTPNGLLFFQVAAALAGIMGTLGFILAMVGVYGVLSYVVSQKTSEIGIRMALGAQRGDILRIIYRQGLWIVGIGLVLGLGATFAAAHLLRSMIVVSPMDPATYVGVSAALVAIALLACYIPAHRAMHVEPMRALRTE
jgi:macrolide transport system ATP-binding/permease protein